MDQSMFEEKQGRLAQDIMHIPPGADFSAHLKFINEAEKAGFMPPELAATVRTNCAACHGTQILMALNEKRISPQEALSRLQGWEGHKSVLAARKAANARLNH